MVRSNLQVLLAALLLWSHKEVLAADPSRMVSLPLGNIQGAPCPINPRVTQYLGVPFAQPALGNLRFRSPELYSTPYSKPALQATTPPPPCGSVCGQMWMPDDASGSSEDCLFLSIWVPEAARVAPVAVRVYIHGGMQNRCSASDPHQSGCSVSDITETIQVNMQFRTGAFGLLAHPATWAESNTTGNWAFQDQQLALQWIQMHIAAFGGDPSKVMLFGNSAGAQAVDLHIVAPASAGLFSAAIAESPPCSKFITLQQSYEVGQRLLAKTGCSDGTSQQQLACLRALSWQALVAATGVSNADYGGMFMCEGAAWQPTFHPCVDGVVLTEPRMASLESGRFNRVPYLVGHNSGEGNSYVQIVLNTNGFDVVEGSMASLITTIYPGANPSPILQQYQQANYVNELHPEYAKLSDLWTDIFFTCPIVASLTARKKHQVPTWHYLFTVTPSCPTSEVIRGSQHSAELFYVFGITEMLPPNEGDCNFTTAEVTLSQTMMSAWKSMAETGAPQLPDQVWEEWMPETKTGTVFSLSGATVQPIDHTARCSTIEVAKRQFEMRYPNGYTASQGPRQIARKFGLDFRLTNGRGTVATS